MDTSTKQRGRPTGGKNLVLISLFQLRQLLNDSAKIPISVKFAKSIGFTEDQTETQAQEVTKNQPIENSTPVSFTVSEDF